MPGWSLLVECRGPGGWKGQRHHEITTSWTKRWLRASEAPPCCRVMLSLTCHILDCERVDQDRQKSGFSSNKQRHSQTRELVITQQRAPVVFYTRAPVSTPTLADIRLHCRTRGLVRGSRQCRNLAGNQSLTARYEPDQPLPSHLGMVFIRSG
jgi:hypothetical protein